MNARKIDELTRAELLKIADWLESKYQISLPPIYIIDKPPCCVLYGVGHTRGPCMHLAGMIGIDPEDNIKKILIYPTLDDPKNTLVHEILHIVRRLNHSPDSTIDDWHADIEKQIEDQTQTVLAEFAEFQKVRPAWLR